MKSYSKTPSIMMEDRAGRSPGNHSDYPSSKGKSRRMKLLERQGCFQTDSRSVQIHRSVTVSDFIGAYTLVHDCFVEKKYIASQSSGIRMRVYEAMPDTATFVAKAGNEVVGVISVIMDSPDLLLPSDRAFHEEIQPVRRTSRKLCEISNWAISPAYRRTSILTDLFRCFMAHLFAMNCQDAVAAISPSHKAFFALMGFDEVLGSERSYSETTNDPVLLVRLSMNSLFDRFSRISTDDSGDLAALKTYYVDSNPYSCQMEAWDRSAQKAFSDPVFLRQLFVEHSNLLADCTNSALEAIRRRWGDNLFLDVLGHNVIYDSFYLGLFL